VPRRAHSHTPSARDVFRKDQIDLLRRHFAPFIEAFDYEVDDAV